jgi:diaminopimelate decarboxylase
VSGIERVDGSLALGGVSLEACMARLEKRSPGVNAFYAYDLEALDARARRLARAFEPVGALVAYALKANALPAILERVAACGLGADAGSLGELRIAASAGFQPGRTVLNGNGRTPAEATWAAANGIGLVNADLIPELDLLDRAAREAGRTLRVALRVNPGIETPGHRYVATGGDDAKFGVCAEEALEAWAGRARWPSLKLDGVHVHVGSQLLDPAPILEAVDETLALVDAARERGAPLGLVNVGGGLGVDYGGSGAEFPLDAYARALCEKARGRGVDWIIEPGRWLVAPVGVLVARVLWVKQRGERRFVVIAAGMNDLIRPALYGARHRIVPLRPRGGPARGATVVGPVCESADVFGEDVELPPLEPGDLLAILDAGAYGAVMASNYNGRGRLAEVVLGGGEAHLAREAERPEELASRVRSVRL